MSCNEVFHGTHQAKKIESLSIIILNLVNSRIFHFISYVSLFDDLTQFTHQYSYSEVNKSINQLGQIKGEKKKKKP